ncbi:TetR/AcrR family transcriptional regulator [Achromobacter pestifer]|uniref:TetR/AcrR family transcriptional regulator n=1 Tax=Achromobacter pestifer TaxID=1353889 RepID=A0A7D4IIY8_9BURK|nr:TetR/AcrR family transcriptional regulator [Achromobacter pestifer]QKH36803.1 TetR/AcrR family transcriptional regulator [Achromobacter pestifer]
MTTKPTSTAKAVPQRRLSRDERQRQLLDVAWKLISGEGTDALTLGRLAAEAGITKPVAYDHFGTRNGLLVALYQDFDVRQTALIDAAIAASKPVLKEKARVIAAGYIECVMTQGREIPGVLAALGGSPELAAVKHQYQLAFIKKCQAILAPYAGPAGIAQAGMWAMLGAADGLAHAAVAQDIGMEQARDELMQTIVAMVKRSK